MEKEIEILCEFKFVFKWASVAILDFFIFDQFSIHCYAQVGLQEYHTLVNMFKWVGGCYVNLVFFLWLKYVYD
jgi:hypothetical protein